jgi:hypothetical protein
MTRLLPLTLLALVAALASPALQAKLPAPSDEAKAKSAEAAAKTAHAGKVDAYKLCQAMDKVAASYQASAKKAGKPASAPVDTPACADPGPFVYVLAGAASAPAATAAPTAASAVAKK